MLTKTFQYTDYNGKSQIETLYFNMSKAEIAAFQVRMDGKFIDHLKTLVEGGKIEELFGFFRDLVLDSYGEKSEDGKRFYKTPEMRKDFEASIVFSELIVELMQSKKNVIAFTKAILPPDFQDIEIPDDEESAISSDATSISSLPPNS